MNLLSFLLRTYKKKLALVVVVGIIAGTCNASLIVTINLATKRNGAQASNLVWFFLLAATLVLIAGVASQVLTIYIGQSAIYDVRMRLSRRVANAPLRQFEEIGPDRLLATLTEDINTIAVSLLAVADICVSLVTVILCLSYLAYLSWAAFLGLVGFITVGIVIYQALQSRAIRMLTKAREERDALMKRFRSLTEGAKELRLHRRRREEFVEKHLGATAASLLRLNLAGFTRYAVAGTWSQLLFCVVIGLLLFALPLVKDISFTVLVGYTIIVLYIRGPIGMVVSALPLIGQGNVAMRKVHSLGLELLVDIPEGDDTTECKGYSNRLDLSGVTHSYHNEEYNNFVLGPLDVRFQPAEIVFLIGGNGSGKSTFAKLLAGLYTPETGEIRLDGTLITDQTREFYRNHFSVVFYDFYLFETLLGMLSPELDQQAEYYLGTLRLKEKVQIKDGVLSTTKLSQGERKRLALLTAYLEDRPFYIFDEWASDQDPEFRDLFYTTLLPELKSRGKTVLVITHDDRYFHVADRTIKLDYGMIVTASPRLDSLSYTLPIPSFD